MIPRLFSLLAAGALGLTLALPAQAATLPSADFKPGQTMGLGLAGLSYDYAFPRVSLGASLAATNPWSPNFAHMQLGARAAYRFLQADGLSAGVIGGVVFDPGQPGGRSYMIPDVGLGAAYRFTLFTLPLSVRFNFTLTADQGQASAPYAQYPVDPNSVQPRGNFLQRLTAGPNTMIGLAYQPSDTVEVTLGSGTLVGVRFSF
ncbi:MAG: hypothetical protein ACK46X_05290 [Candidatus Sericytochromatia bacterium]